MANLESLRELHTWMRAEGILYARCGELELRLEPERPAPPTAEPEMTEAERKKRDLDDLLHSSGVSSDELLKLMGQAA